MTENTELVDLPSVSHLRSQYKKLPTKLKSSLKTEYEKQFSSPSRFAAIINGRQPMNPNELKFIDNQLKQLFHCLKS